MVFQNCSPPNYSGPGKTVTNIVSMHVDYTTETIDICINPSFQPSKRMSPAILGSASMNARGEETCSGLTVRIALA
ncbi:uncharacterized protein PGTG_11715 [Puccinia graminis f. sp. tritici CRL 75-36-700-3]|uniref:Uncharacterized protein n=1 Tax=Puccinia graminis f. sp. tritici (strain CRL 75-36-700-3 / race SCCL) TaxID=418459 RepID=E3KNT4_PUCGT|nr:uncharacterized protein PGTG_11715 [Puccinia graminis f. sp. tritici CRL 75-36-700-3]EFP85959.1 hypothetical protein PGTG_11715 [Puccinia graminis f. sp. tritici CRL 75-36-700-3]